MNRLFQTALIIVWGLWFGGLIMLFLCLQSLFHKTFPLDRTIAGNAASDIFKVFNEFRLGLAGGALILTAGWWMAGRSTLKLTAFAFFSLAVVAAVASTAILTPQIEHLRAEGMTQSAEFTRLHMMSMCVYLIETILVFLAGLILPNVGKLIPPRPNRLTP